MADEQTNPENDPVVEQPAEAEAAQEESTQTEQAPEAQETAVSHEHRNQWIIFGILVGILFGVVLAIAVLRPLIFNRIVPAVMGDFVTPVPASVDETLPAEDQTLADEAAPVDETINSEEATSGENEIFIPAASTGGGSPDSAEAEGSETMEGETAVSPPPAPEPTTHTVQVGDNLTKISQQYGVSVQEIMAANNITNADYISVGQVLIIPTN